MTQAQGEMSFGGTGSSRGLWYGTEGFVLGLWKTRNIWKLPINYYS